ncbi:MAG: phosphohistidine phosphatase SixA [Candidatus Omnitrophica bacterium]|nr:phosphohistidine phosphatase SixA [Candidatus Omnitrophota bacterium]
MKLYLLRHGEACSGGDDAHRQLTGKGRRQAQCVAKFLKDTGAQVDCIWHSNRTRAVQTAEQVQSVLGAQTERMEQEGLGPGDMAILAAGRIESFFVEQDGRSLLVVSHLPFLPQLARELLGGKATVGVVDFPEAGILCLKKEGSEKWDLEWVTSPELLWEE